MIWTKYAGVLLSFDDRKCFWFCIYYKVFLNILCEHPRVRLTFWKLMCWICLHPRVRLKFYVRLKIHYKLTLDLFEDVEFLLRSFRMSCTFPVMSSPKMMQLFHRSSCPVKFQSKWNKTCLGRFQDCGRGKGKNMQIFMAKVVEQK